MPLFMPSPAVILSQGGAAISVGATTDETALVTVKLPAQLLGLNGRVYVHTLWSYTNSGNSKTYRLRLGGLSGTVFAALVVTTTTLKEDLRFFANRNALNSQIVPRIDSVPYTTTTGSLGTGSIDTSADQDIVISGQKASSGETLTLEAYQIFAYPRGAA